jgi:hypothetical protein
MGGVSNSSGASSYSDFTSLPPAKITRGDTQNIGLDPGFPNRPYYECWKVWIDYNRDNDFDDPDEEVFTTVSDTSITGSFTVPCCCVTGLTRMRVSMSYNVSGCPPMCGTFAYGEVEEYSVEIH